MESKEANTTRGSQHPMYCEITILHRGPIDEKLLAPSIVDVFKNPLDLAVAYARSAIYKNMNPAPLSLCAFQLESECFVIFRKVATVRYSMFHVEGNHPQVPVTTLLQAVQKFSRELMSQLRNSKLGRAYRPRELNVKLFEDNGKETGVVGEQVTMGSIIRAKFAWKEISPPLITFMTAVVLLWTRLDSRPLPVAVYTLGVVAFFIMADTVAECWWRAGKIEWKSSVNS